MIILKGDLLKTPFEIIAHQVNCQGKMASGVAKQIREKFPDVYSFYMAIIKIEGAEKMLGRGQVVLTQSTAIFNIFGQYDYGYDGKKYTSYQALKSGFIEAIKFYREACDLSEDYKFRIAIPYKIGCDRGGGNWSIVKVILEDIEKHCNVVFVAYKLE